jgi:hypothetical protein
LNPVTALQLVSLGVPIRNDQIHIVGESRLAVDIARVRTGDGVGDPVPIQRVGDIVDEISLIQAFSV